MSHGRKPIHFGGNQSINHPSYFICQHEELHTILLIIIRSRYITVTVEIGSGWVAAIHRHGRICGTHSCEVEHLVKIQTLRFVMLQFVNEIMKRSRFEIPVSPCYPWPLTFQSCATAIILLNLDFLITSFLDACARAEQTYGLMDRQQHFVILPNRDEDYIKTKTVTII